MKVVIIGGVAGGASAAARLRRLDEDAEIVMLERTGYVSYANCGLPYYVGGVITDRGKLTLQTPASFAARFNVDARVNSEVVSIDRAAKTVRVRSTVSGEEYDEGYDVLLLSPGAKAIRPDIPGMDDPRVMTLRTVEDTLAMRRFVEENDPKSAVVCGAGYIGLEVAENLAGLGIHVTVVQRPDHVLPPLDRDMAADVHHHIRSKGVRLVLSDALESLDTDGPLSVILRDGESIETDMAVIALGVTPDTHLARDAGLEMGVKGTIVVDPHMRTSDPSVYAVGDAVQVSNYVTGLPANIALAGPANRQGRIAAENIAGGDAEYRGSLGSSVIKVFDMTVATTGINERQAKEAGIQYDKVYTFSAPHATYYPGGRNMSVKTLFDPVTGTVLGAQIVGYEGVEKRVDVIATAIHAGMTVQDLAELDLSYAPPYSSAKDPVNYAGFVASNVMDGLVRQFFWDEVEAIKADPSSFLLDVRTPTEFSNGHIEGSVNIPVDELRSRLDEVPRDRHVRLICQSALRSYIAARVLEQLGYECSHLAGGYRLYASVVRDMAADAEAMPCGVPRRSRSLLEALHPGLQAELPGNRLDPGEGFGGLVRVKGRRVPPFLHEQDLLGVVQRTIVRVAEVTVLRADALEDAFRSDKVDETQGRPVPPPVVDVQYESHAGCTDLGGDDSDDGREASSPRSGMTCHEVRIHLHERRSAGRREDVRQGRPERVRGGTLPERGMLRGMFPRGRGRRVHRALRCLRGGRCQGRHGGDRSQGARRIHRAAAGAAGRLREGIQTGAIPLSPMQRDQCKVAMGR